MVLLHIELQIGKQEVDDFVLIVIEALGVPGTVVALCALVEELVGSTVKEVEAFPGVLAGVGMDHVQKHRDAQLMGFINKPFQRLGSSETGGDRKEIADLVAERAVVGMLHDRHDLNGVVAKLVDAGQNVFPELIEGANLALLLAHTDMALVNKKVLLGHKAAVRPLEFLLGIIDHRVPGDGLGILEHPLCVQGDAVQFLPVVDYNRNHGHAVLEGVRSLEEEFEHAVLLFLHRMLIAVPAAEITGEVHLLRGRCPLPVVPAVLCLVKTKVAVAVCKIRQGLSLFQQFLFLFRKALGANIKIFFERLHRRVVFKNLVIHTASSFREIYVISLPRRKNRVKHSCAFRHFTTLQQEIFV